MQEVEQLVNQFVASDCPATSQGRTRDTVNGKYVDIDTCNIVAMPTFDKRGAGINNLAKTAWEGVAGLDAQCLQRLWQPLTGMRHEAVVVRTRHADVHVVVPRNKPLVAHSAQHCAGPTIIPYFMLTTHMVYRKKNL